MTAYMLAPLSFLRPPGHRRHARYRCTSLALWALALVPFCQASAAAPDTVPPGEARQDCTLLFDPESPALFDFVNTRSQVDFRQYEGMQIGTLTYKVLPIFNERDDDEDNWIFRLANKLHIDTRHTTLKKQMIISPGETLESHRLQENERILRSNSYLVDAMILPHRQCGDSLDLLVVARDVWTFSPSANASRSGGEDSTSAGISDTNLLGLGQRLSIGYFHEEDRSGSTLSYTNPLLGDRTELDLFLADNSDGDAIGVAVIRPFYELDSRNSAGISLYREKLEQSIEENGVEINRFTQQENIYEVFYGVSGGRRNDAVQRWRVGFAEDSDRFSAVDGTVTLPEDAINRYPWISWDFQQDKFATADNINRTHRQEDIQLGYSHIIKLGYSHTDFGSDEKSLIFELGTGYSAYVQERHLTRLSAYTFGQRNSDTVRSMFFGVGADYYFFINEKNRWYVKYRFDGARNIRQDEQLTIGGVETLRGYPNEYQRGNRRWLMSVERRRFTNWHILNLAYLGVAGYIDAGKVWDTETAGTGDTDTLANIGFGLRLSPSKFRLDRILHIDVAAPLRHVDLVDDYQVIISGRVDF